MTDIEYQTILANAIRRFGSLINERENIDLEITKLRQFIRATANMLPDSAREKLLESFDEIDNRIAVTTMSLIDSVRNILQNKSEKWLTVSGVKSLLQTEGFDFSSYTSNPLSSVSTTLRRLKEYGEVETDEIEGVTVYKASTKNLKKPKYNMFLSDIITPPPQQTKNALRARAFGASPDLAEAEHKLASNVERTIAAMIKSLPKK